MTLNQNIVEGLEAVVRTCRTAYLMRETPLAPISNVGTLT